MSRGQLLALLLLASCWCTTAYADEQRLTDRGRLMPGGSVGGYWSNNHDSPGLTAYSDRAVLVAPSLTYFVTDRFGIGGYASYAYDKERSFGIATKRSHDLGAGLQAIVELPLSARLGLLCRASVGYDHRWLRVRVETQDSFAGAQRYTQQQRLQRDFIHRQFDGLELNAFVPLMFYFSASVGLGLGPYLDWQLYESAPKTQQLRVGAGSWLASSF